jgi:hypothetical protein
VAFFGTFFSIKESTEANNEKTNLAVEEHQQKRHGLLLPTVLWGGLKRVV